MSPSKWGDLLAIPMFLWLTFYFWNKSKERDLTHQEMILMALSTIRAETESFCPISEYKSKYNTSPSSDHPYDKYDYRKDLGNQGPPDGDSFKGE
jgi:peptidoglycan L-alanyl-D-glutamate endopeptidase CwlK